MRNTQIRTALREVHEFLLSDPEQFISPEAYQERKREALNHFYTVHDYLLGGPRGEKDATDNTYLVEWVTPCKISAVVRAASVEEAEQMMREGDYPTCEESIWPEYEDSVIDGMRVTPFYLS